MYINIYTVSIQRNLISFITFVWHTGGLRYRNKTSSVSKIMNGLWYVPLSLYLLPLKNEVSVRSVCTLLCPLYLLNNVKHYCDTLFSCYTSILSVYTFQKNFSTVNTVFHFPLFSKNYVFSPFVYTLSKNYPISTPWDRTSTNTDVWGCIKNRISSTN